MPVPAKRPGHGSANRARPLPSCGPGSCALPALVVPRVSECCFYRLGRSNAGERKQWKLIFVNDVGEEERAGFGLLTRRRCKSLGVSQSQIQLGIEFPDCGRMPGCAYATPLNLLRLCAICWSFVFWPRIAFHGGTIPTEQQVIPRFRDRRIPK